MMSLILRRVLLTCFSPCVYSSSLFFRLLTWPLVPCCRPFYHQRHFGVSLAQTSCETSRNIRLRTTGHTS